MDQGRGLWIAPEEAETFVLVDQARRADSQIGCPLESARLRAADPWSRPLRSRPDRSSSCEGEITGTPMKKAVKGHTGRLAIGGCESQRTRVK